MHQEHPAWGKRRIADEMAKANAWERVVSANTVRRILRDEDLWSEQEGLEEKKKEVQPAVRQAEKPGQTVNVDLCFVPATHESAQKLPAVSGSSGRLVVAQLHEEPVEPDYPGRVFAKENLTYEQAMLAFVKASAEQKPPPIATEVPEEAARKVQKRALRQEELDLRAKRRTVRQQRQVEDAVW